MRSALPVLVALLALGCVSHLPPTAADFDATITRADFADWLASYKLETKHETLTKSEKDGIVILEYDWLGDDGELAIGIHSRVYWTKSSVEALAAYRKMRDDPSRDKGVVAWIPLLCGGTWAEEKKCYRLVRIDNQVVGHLEFARRGNIAMMVMLTGMHSEDARLFDKKIEPELWKLSKHDPRKAPPASH